MAEITLDGGTYTGAENATELIITGNVTITDWSGITKVTVKNGATVTTDKWSSDIALTVDLEGVTRQTNGADPIINYIGEGDVSYGTVNVINGTLGGGYVIGNDLYAGNYVYYNSPNYSEETTAVVIKGTTFNVNGNVSTYDNAAAANFDVYNLSKEADAHGGVAVFSDGTYKQETGDNKPVSNRNGGLSGNAVFYNSTVDTTENFYFTGWNFASQNANPTAFEVSLYNTTVNETAYIAYNTQNLNVPVTVNLDSSTVSVLHLCRSHATFKKTLTVNVTNSKLTNGFKGAGAGYTRTNSVHVNVTGGTLGESYIGNSQAVNSAKANNPTDTGSASHIIDGDIKWNLSGVTAGNLTAAKFQDSTPSINAPTTKNDKLVISSNNVGVMRAVEIDGTTYYTHSYNANGSVNVVTLTNNSSASIGFHVFNNYTVSGDVTISISGGSAGDVSATSDRQVISAVNTVGFTGNTTITETPEKVSAVCAISYTIGGDIRISLSDNAIANNVAGNKGADLFNGGVYITLNGATVKNTLAGYSDTKFAATTYDAENSENGYASTVIRSATIRDGANLTVSGSGNYAKTLQNFNTVTIDAGASVTVNAIANIGTITVDASGLAYGIAKVIDAATASTYNAALTENSANAGIFQNGEDLFIYSTNGQTQVALNAAWNGKKEGDAVTVSGKTFYYGINAFSDAADVVSVAGGTIYLAGGEFGDLDANGAAIVVTGKVILGDLTNAANVTIASGGELHAVSVEDGLNVTVQTGYYGSSAKANVSPFSTVNGAENLTVTYAGTLSATQVFYKSGNAYWFSGHGAGDTYVDTGWTSQADVDKAGIAAVWGTNAFNAISTALGNTRAGNTIHFVGGTNTATLGLNGVNISTEGGTFAANMHAGTLTDEAIGSGDIYITLESTWGAGNGDNRVYAGGKDTSPATGNNIRFGNTYLTVKEGAELNQLYGGGMGTITYGNLYATLNGATITNLYGGSSENNNVAVYHGDVNITLNATTVTSNFFGAHMGGSSYNHIRPLEFNGNINIDINKDSRIANLFGGNYDSGGSYKVVVNGETTSVPFGLDPGNVVNGNINIDISGASSTGTIYAAGYNTVNGNITVSISEGTTINGHVFMSTNVKANDPAIFTVNGDTTLNLSNSTVKQNIYLVADGYTNGNVTANFTNATVNGAMVAYADKFINTEKSLSLNFVGTNTFGGDVTTFGSANFAAGATLTVKTWKHSGTITIDASTLNGELKVIDATNTSTYGEVNFINAENKLISTFTEANDLYVKVVTVDKSVVYVNSEWADEEKNKEVAVNGGANTAFIGHNAFATVAEAQAAVAENGVICLDGGVYTSPIGLTELVITGDVTINDWTGITKVTVKNGATITTNNWSDAISLTVDLDGVTRQTNGAAAIINYTGSEREVAYGYVNILGGTNSGGYIIGNDLYAGNHVYYNDPEFTEATDSVVIKGTTFGLTYGTITYTYADASAAKLQYKSHTVSGTNVNAFNYGAAGTDIYFLSRAADANNGVVVLTGNAYSLTTGGTVADEGTFSANTVWYGTADEKLTITASENFYFTRYNVNVNDPKSVTASLDNVILNKTAIFVYGSNMVNVPMTVNIENSTTNTLQFGRSNGGYGKKFTLNLINTTVNGCVHGSQAGPTRAADIEWNFIGTTVAASNGRSIHIGNAQGYNRSATKAAYDHIINGSITFNFAGTAERATKVSGAVHGAFFANEQTAVFGDSARRAALLQEVVIDGNTYYTQTYDENGKIITLGLTVNDKRDDLKHAVFNNFDVSGDINISVGNNAYVNSIYGTSDRPENTTWNTVGITGGSVAGVTLGKNTVGTYANETLLTLSGYTGTQTSSNVCQALSYTVGGDINIRIAGGTVTDVTGNKEADLLSGGVYVTISGGTVLGTVTGYTGTSFIYTEYDAEDADGNGFYTKTEIRSAIIRDGATLTASGIAYANAVVNFNTITVTADDDAATVDKFTVNSLSNVGAITIGAGAELCITSMEGLTNISIAAGGTLTINTLTVDSCDELAKILRAEGAVLNIGKLNINNSGDSEQVISDIEFNGNLFGAGDAETTAAVDLTIADSTTGAVLGGASSSGSKVGTDSAEGFVGGTINLALTNSNVGTVYGGGYSSETGKITLNISGSTCNKMVYGGNVTNTGSLTDDTESTIGDVALTINGGEFKDKVVGGSRVVASENSDANVTTKVGNVTLNIDGGDFADTIFGAGYILGNKNGTGNESNAQLKVAGVTMTLNDMTITNTNTLHGIYAGGLAARGANISVGTAQTRSAGSAVSITINSGKYTSIYGGGWAESGATVTVYGVSINVTGGEIANLYGGGNNDQSGARTYVDGDVLITISGGKVDNVCAGAKFVTSKVKGSSTIQITGNATIGNLCGLSNNNYDGVLYDQTLDVDAALSCNSISGFDKIDIAAAIDVAGNVDMFGKGIVNIDLAGFAAEADAEWTVLSAAELNNLEAVTFGTAEVVSEVNKWSCGAYTLTFNDNADGDDTLVLKYTKLA